MLNFDYENETDRFVELYVNSEQGTPDHYLGSVGICNNPLCDCQKVELNIHNASKNSEKYAVSLNLKKRNLSDNAHESVDTAAFSDTLIDQLTEQDWNELSTVYRRFKAYYSENISDFDSLNADFSNHLKGNLVRYNEILPLSSPVPIGKISRQLAGYDLYCPTPKCDCNTATLEIFYADEKITLLTEKNSFAITVNFKKRILLSIDDECTIKGKFPTPEEIMTLINKNGDTVWTSLEKRYNNIRTLYRQYLKHSTHKNKNVVSFESNVKVGRNEPCPCGSGKKYKKCCL